MNVNSQFFGRILSVQMMAKVISSFDRNMVTVISVSWGAALLVMAVAIYTVMLAVSTHRAARDAKAIEPPLPIIKHDNVLPQDMARLKDRLEQRYPDVTFSVRDRALTVTALDGARYRQWLTALAYIDTISPQLHWAIKDLCVGKCQGSELMHATILADKITFSIPEGDAKK